jgi:hypothetical protein
VHEPPVLAMRYALQEDMMPDWVGPGAAGLVLVLVVAVVGGALLVGALLVVGDTVVVLDTPTQ